MFPPRVVLAAVDFSEPSRTALTFAARLAKHAAGQLHVLHAQDPLLAAAARATGVDLASETRSELGTFMQQAAPAGDWSPFHHVVEGPAVTVIGEIAERENADVIVIGAHGMSGVTKTFFGSTTEGVLRKADCSVLVVPASWAPAQPSSDDLRGTGPVIVGLELTPTAIAAARAGGALAKLLNTAVEIRHVVPSLPVLSRWTAHAVKAHDLRLKAARDDVASALRYLTDIPRMTMEIETGGVAEQLAAAARVTRDRHPLLVMGRRTHGERGGTPGSIAVRVVGATEVPVLMYLPDQ